MQKVQETAKSTHLFKSTWETVQSIGESLFRVLAAIIWRDSFSDEILQRPYEFESAN